MLPFKFTGKIIPGDKTGRKIGFPTANFDRIPNETSLKPGVYLGTCKIFQEEYLKNQDLKCLAYFGPRHILGQTKNTFEVYIYNLNQNIYESTVEATLTQFIREPKKVTSLVELKRQLEKDKKQGLSILQV